MTIGDYLEAVSAPRRAAAPVCRQLDQPQLRHLDRPRGGQHRLGRPASTRDICVKHQPRPSPTRHGIRGCAGARRPGKKSTSPRAATGSGGSATITLRARTRCSITSSASILQNVYTLLGDAPPPDLARPISRRGHGCQYTQPRAFLEVQIDGRYFLRVAQRRPLLLPERTRHDGHGHDRGRCTTCTSVSTWTACWMRVDCDGPARDALADFDALRIGFIEPPGFEVRSINPATAPTGQWNCAATARRAGRQVWRCGSTRSPRWRSPSTLWAWRSIGRAVLRRAVPGRPEPGPGAARGGDHLTRRRPISSRSCGTCKISR